MKKVSLLSMMFAAIFYAATYLHRSSALTLTMHNQEIK